LEENVNCKTLKKLLIRLKKHECFQPIPIDASTLLNTPRSIVVTPMSPGFYYHFGLKTGIFQFLLNHPKFNEQIKIVFHIDGLPVSKSSSN